MACSKVDRENRAFYQDWTDLVQTVKVGNVNKKEEKRKSQAIFSKK